ncbi:TRP-domain-containing protein [Myriangium duriaei CBS 260.36]|uniref:TRP-domain-containing protein n=1 Tax=Myriangium duriaei CBS 260.36 TaxID=1168546 RepID=A0A9P4JA34_9PEZI|nr:TRP-domain-containing protein [Myriangium duriaei CBS 260.36]
MRCSRVSRLLPVLFLSTLPVGVLGDNVLTTNGFTTCIDNPSLKVLNLNIQFDKTTNNVTFDVSGESDAVQNVTASLVATAYGKQVYQRDFNPCDSSTYVQQLCPVPQGVFSAQGTQQIPQQYVNQIPSIAFNIPDLDGQATLQLKNGNGTSVACIQSSVGNGKTMDVPAVKYVAAGVAASAFALSALGAIGHASAGAGAAAPSPTFGEVIGWFQTIATSGMLSVNYPSVYQSFTRNFAFSTGIISWGQMQTAIDNFRRSTGGNLTDDNYQYLQNVTIVNSANTNGTVTGLLKRAAAASVLLARDITTDVNGQTSSINGNGTSTNGTSSSSTTSAKGMHYVHGIQAYVEKLMVPQANTFMTVLLIFLCVVGVITVFILLFKVILEAAAMASKLPKSLESFRKRYWWRLAKIITNLVFLLYGSWVLYCVYQFTIGDSWATKVLAGVTLAIFTGILGFFAFKIWSKARAFKKIDGDSSALFEDKEVWIKYSLFYDAFKQGSWWVFIPAIVYMFARNAVIAAANGHGMAQAIGQMIVEGLMLLLLVFQRPYQRKSGNVINIIIQTVRILSVVCILVFVEELGFSQTTQTITGVALIVVQSSLTGLLGILLAVNAIMACVRDNPHRRRRKEAEKQQRDLDNLTPLDARNSLLMDSAQLADYKGSLADGNMYKAPLVSRGLSPTMSHGSYDPVPARDASPPGYGSPMNRVRGAGGRWGESRDNLVGNAAGIAGRERSMSPKPTLPQVSFGRTY